MSKFKIGDKVREIATGDEGIIVENDWYTPLDSVNVSWTTGMYKGVTLHIECRCVELLYTLQITFEQAMQTLLQLGYKVTVEKI